MRSNDVNSEGCQVIDDFDSVCSDVPNYLNDLDMRKLQYANQIQNAYYCTTTQQAPLHPFLPPSNTPSLISGSSMLSSCDASVNSRGQKIIDDFSSMTEGSAMTD